MQIQVLDGQVTWLEVVCDDESELAASYTGPQSFEFDVHESLSVSVSDTSAVRVTRNGQNVPFESKIQGLGSLSIQGTQQGSSPSGADGDSASASSSASSSTTS